MRHPCRLCADVPELGFFDDDVLVAGLSDEHACRGHTMVVARRHVENVSELGEDEASRFFARYREIEGALLRVFGADRVLAVKLGLAVPHLHIHLYPVSRDVTREEVDAILARRVRLEPSRNELDMWMGQLSREMGR